MVRLTKRFYEGDDESVLPRSIASFKAFENAITLDIAMGGSTNTVLHILAAAQEAGVDFTMADIDRISRVTPCVCKVAPAVQNVHIEDVHRAGGIMGILGELARGGLLDTDAKTVHAPTLGHALSYWDIRQTNDEEVTEFFKSTEDIQEAIHRVNTEADVVWVDGHSDYGHAFEVFFERYGKDIGPKTTVLLLGDARNNYHASQSWVVREIRRKARHVYWLNPEPRSYWNTGDSIVGDYGVHTDGVFECRNLRQLESFVEKLA